MTKNLKQAVEDRRSIYALGKEKVVSDERVVEIVEHSVKYAPSAFNNQGSRVLVLLNAEHDKFWDLTKDTLRKVVPAENFPSTEEKLNAFKAGYGTVLFFEDQNNVQALQDGFPLYKDNFPVWAQHASGILQYIVWTSLESEGLGASLQHYSPLVDQAVRDEWKTPENWKLVSQMPFGSVLQGAGEKEFQPLEDRVKVFK